MDWNRRVPLRPYRKLLPAVGALILWCAPASAATTAGAAPEPSNWVLIVAGLVLVIVGSRRPRASVSESREASGDPPDPMLRR